MVIHIGSVMTGIGRDADDRLVNGALENTLKIIAPFSRLRRKVWFQLKSGHPWPAHVMSVNHPKRTWHQEREIDTMMTQQVRQMKRKLTAARIWK
jgi:hypothetical protein